MWAAALVILTLLAIVAALSVAVRLRLQGRAETLFATFVLSNFMVVAPIYGLAAARWLDRPRLAATSLLFSCAVIFGSSSRREPSDWRRELTRAAVALSRVPVEAVALAWRRRSLTLIGLLFFYGAVIWTAFDAYYAPSFRGWDTLWYHEPKVGFVLQNHGFANEPLPLDLQNINGFPSLCEMTDLWFAAFAGRRLIDLANCLMLPALPLGVYVLAYRFAHEKLLAIGWSIAVVLMPAVMAQLQSTLVDPHGAIFLIGAVHFGTRLQFRLRDALLAAVCVALAVSAKYTAIAPAGMVTLIGIGRLASLHLRTRRTEALLVAAGGFAIIGLSVANTYLRNWLWYHNPFWPDVKVDIPSLGIHWPGRYPPHGDIQLGGSVGGMDTNLPFADLMTNLFSRPYSITKWQLGQVHDYGIGVPWILLPFGVAGVLVYFVKAVRAFFPRPPKGGHEAKNAVLVAIPLLTILFTSGCLWGARLNITTVALFAAFAHWVTSSRTWRRAAEGGVAVCVVTGLMMLWWASTADSLHRWWVPPDELLAMIRTPYPEREVSPDFGSGTSLAGGLLREKELQQGDVLVFTDDYGGFPALFWNNQFSNRAQYVPDGPNFVGRALEKHPKWMVLPASHPAVGVLERSGWRRGGTLYSGGFGLILRSPAGT